VDEARVIAAETGPQHAGFKLRNRLRHIVGLLGSAVQLLDEIEDGNPRTKMEAEKIATFGERYGVVGYGENGPLAKLMENARKGKFSPED
jgi:hypothetical protein